ncbi:SDR family NAD(P)-dependent oxidoreductase [Nocardioides sp. S-58]|uniref:SDR family NAD(P)-dependent oxidoreductase n=1 Tax=Nocardioides renjunii TaxID=3095075 RepID=A0ABU5KBF5_9ACTN|nr:SDR family NAD(P)-dependent oxidoreductase [Nocardioides sp. S-58]MDZ5662216.1 SDR family NAD(P)-dependent oxidoreductase [Nocardioides sp. S-58]
MRVLVTGVTSGLGLAVAEALRAQAVEVWGTGRDPVRLGSVAQRTGLHPVGLDHRSLRSVSAAATQLPPIDAVVCNAGVQVLPGRATTDEGLDETVAVNHLSHLALLDAMRRGGNLPATVVLIGSATHDPEQWTGTPPPDESGVVAVAHGRPSEASVRDGLAIYTTTKLMAVATSQALARELPDTTVIAFDPGLMLDTRLGRQHPALLRAMYRSVLRGVRFLPFASTSTVSGRVLAGLVTGSDAVASGSYVDHRRRSLKPSAKALDRDYQAALLTDSRRIIADVVGRSEESAGDAAGH